MTIEIRIDSVKLTNRQTLSLLIDAFGVSVSTMSALLDETKTSSLIALFADVIIRYFDL